MHTLMAWCDLICLAGVPISHARSSGLVHKDGHAILYALNFAFKFMPVLSFYDSEGVESEALLDISMCEDE